MIVVIDYGAGNIGSVLNMFKRLGTKVKSSSDPSEIQNAEKLILPGVGSFDFGMKKLKESNLIDVLNKKVLIDKTPILGICLGVQLMTKSSEEGEMKGLGWFDAETVKFKIPENQKINFKVPHMGWNNTKVVKKSELLTSDIEDLRYYYVHSYHLKTEVKSDILCTSNYLYEFVSGLERSNIIGLQFHPEKSHKFGMKIFENFIHNIK
jgi:glutamine amidotransferase